MDAVPVVTTSYAGFRDCMARYEHLPIYKQALDVAVHFERVVTGFSRYHKYTLGTELRSLSREVVGLVVKANSSRDKLPELMALRERLEALLLAMRIAKEVKAFKSFDSYRHAAELVVSVCRQNEGWIRSMSPEGKKVRGGQNPTGSSRPERA
jgi:hypothetical protein